MTARAAVYILSLHEKGNAWSQKFAIYDAGMQYKSHYAVPRTRMFSNRPAEYDKFSALTPTSFSPVTLGDKLLIIGHGNRTRIAHIGAADLVEQLHGWGLKAVGVVSFKACQIGAGGFLNEFVNRCGTRGIDLGWAKGYTGNTTTKPRHTFYGKPVEVNRAPVGPHKDHRCVIVRGRFANTVAHPAANDAVEMNPF